MKNLTTINRASLFKERNISNLQANANSAQKGEYLPRMADVPSSILIGGNILLQTFLFSVFM